MLVCPDPKGWSAINALWRLPQEGRREAEAEGEGERERERERGSWCDGIRSHDPTRVVDHIDMSIEIRR
jgi:hypothetical protein